MISGRHDRYARPQQVDRDFSCDPASCSRVLAVNDHKVDPPSLLEPRHHINYGFSPGFSNNVAKE
jgi:hypothetical protein